MKPFTLARSSANGIAILFLVSATGGLAGPSSSANYRIVADRVDAGGHSAASGNYTQDGSLGGITGGSSIEIPMETVKHGYIGQLYEITGFEIAASPDTVDEGGTIQLHAYQILDDLTKLAVPAETVEWSVLDGPLTSIDTAGLATADLVYQDTAATAQGVYLAATGTLGVTVLNTIPDNYGSYAGDAIDDAWQIQYFGLDNPLAAPDLDPDGDGETNLFEFIAGVNPTDPNSHFRFRIESVPGEPAQKNLIFSPRLEDRTYTALSAETLSAAAFAPLPSFSITDNGDERTLTDLNATAPATFYRIGISKP